MYIARDLHSEDIKNSYKNKTKNDKRFKYEFLQR